MSDENKPKITKDMSLGETAQRYPETAEVFGKYNLHCFGCPMATMETIEQGALAHAIDLEKLLAELNQAVEEETNPEPVERNQDQEAETQDSQQSV